MAQHYDNWYEDQFQSGSESANPSQLPYTQPPYVTYPRPVLPPYRPIRRPRPIPRPYPPYYPPYHDPTVLLPWLILPFLFYGFRPYGGIHIRQSHEEAYDSHEAHSEYEHSGESAHQDYDNPGALPADIMPRFHKHTVRPGDTMWKIAEHYGVSLDLLTLVNPHIKDPNVIHPGDVINVPIFKFAATSYAEV